MMDLAWSWQAFQRQAGAKGVQRSAAESARTEISSEERPAAQTRRGTRYRPETDEEVGAPSRKIRRPPGYRPMEVPAQGEDGERDYQDYLARKLPGMPTPGIAGVGSPLFSSTQQGPAATVASPEPPGEMTRLLTAPKVTYKDLGGAVGSSTPVVTSSGPAPGDGELEEGDLDVSDEALKRWILDSFRREMRATRNSPKKDGGGLNSQQSSPDPKVTNIGASPGTSGPGGAQYGTPIYTRPATPYPVGTVAGPDLYTTPTSAGRTPRMVQPPLFTGVGRFDVDSPATKARTRLPDLRSYDGKERWETYWQHLVSVVALNQWSDAEATQFLLMALKEKAAEVAFLPPGGRPWTFTALCLALAEACGTDADVGTHQIELQILRQKPEESLQDLALRVRRKVREAYPNIPGAAQEQLATGFFKTALEKEKAREFVGMFAPTTLQEALVLARRAENQERINKLRDEPTVGAAYQFREVKGDPTGTDKTRPGGPVATAATEPTPPPKGETDKVREMKVTGGGVEATLDRVMGDLLREIRKIGDRRPFGRGRGSPTDARPGPCWTCGEVGHLARACRKPRGDGARKDGNRRSGEGDQKAASGGAEDKKDPVTNSAKAGDRSDVVRVLKMKSPEPDSPGEDVPVDEEEGSFNESDYEFDRAMGVEDAILPPSQSPKKEVSPTVSQLEAPDALTDFPDSGVEKTQEEVPEEGDAKEMEASQMPKDPVRMVSASRPGPGEEFRGSLESDDGSSESSWSDRNSMPDSGEVACFPPREDLRELTIAATLRVTGCEPLEVKCLIDTGAEVNIMSRAIYWRHFRDNLPLTPAARRLTAADGKEISVEGIGYVPLDVGGRVLTVRVVVADMETALVLGMDFISRHRCTWDWDAGTLKLGDLTAGLKHTRVLSQHDLRIPACSEYVTAGKLTAVIPLASSAMIIGSGALCRDPGVVVANTLVDPRVGTVPVRILNPQGQAVQLPRGTTLGTLTEAEVVEPGQQWVRQVRVGGSVEEDDSDLPEEVKAAIQDLPAQLTAEQRRQARELLREYVDIVAVKGKPLGHTDLVQHRIDTGDALPIRQPPRREPQAFRGEGAKEVRRMLDEGIVEPADGPWASPVVLVKKPDGSIRYCVDYRKVNAVTRKDAYPLPRIEDCLDRLAGSTWFSTIDLAAGYWQVAVHPADRDKTAFVTPDGLFRFRVMPFGLANAPATFERLMERVLVGLRWETAIIYLDDVIVHATGFDEHLRQLRAVFERFRQARLKLKLKKCSFLTRRLSFWAISSPGPESPPILRRLRK